MRGDALDRGEDLPADLAHFLFFRRVLRVGGVLRVRGALVALLLLLRPPSARRGRRGAALPPRAPALLVVHVRGFRVRDRSLRLARRRARLVRRLRDDAEHLRIFIPVLVLRDAGGESRDAAVRRLPADDRLVVVLLLRGDLRRVFVRAMASAAALGEVRRAHFEQLVVLVLAQAREVVRHRARPPRAAAGAGFALVRRRRRFVHDRERLVPVVLRVRDRDVALQPALRAEDLPAVRVPALEPLGSEVHVHDDRGLSAARSARRPRGFRGGGDAERRGFPPRPRGQVLRRRGLAPALALALALARFLRHRGGFRGRAARTRAG
eukprot:31194-Pelagococcus_subviridis.AAC.24